MGFQMVSDKTILNEHPILVMLRSLAKFWAVQEGRVRTLLLVIIGLKTLSYWWVTIVFRMKA